MKSWGSTTSVGYSLLFSSCVHNAASSTPLSGEKMTMILQQSATFERKSDGAIAIQCSVCFFSGFSTCHCSSSNAHAVAGSTQAAQQTPSSKSKKVSAANAASASPSAPPSKKGGGLPTSPSTKNNINEESSQTSNTLTDAEAKLRLGTW